MAYLNLLIRYFFKIDPHTLSDEEWQDRASEAMFLRDMETKNVINAVNAAFS